MVVVWASFLVCDGSEKPLTFSTCTSTPLWMFSEGFKFLFWGLEGAWTTHAEDPRSCCSTHVKQLMAPGTPTPGGSTCSPDSTDLCTHKEGDKNIWKTVVLVHYCDTQKGGEVFSLSPATFQTLGDSKKSQSPRIIGRLWLTASTFFKKFKYWDISVPVHSVYTNPSCSQLCNWPAFSQS